MGINFAWGLSSTNKTSIHILKNLNKLQAGETKRTWIQVSETTGQHRKRAHLKRGQAEIIEHFQNSMQRKLISQE